MSTSVKACPTVPNRVSNLSRTISGEERREKWALYPARACHLFAASVSWGGPVESDFSRRKRKRERRLSPKPPGPPTEYAEGAPAGPPIGPSFRAPCRAPCLAPRRGPLPPPGSELAGPHLALHTHHAPTSMPPRPAPRSPPPRAPRAACASPSRAAPIPMSATALALRPGGVRVCAPKPDRGRGGLPRGADQQQGGAEQGSRDQQWQ